MVEVDLSLSRGFVSTVVYVLSLAQLRRHELLLRAVVISVSLVVCQTVPLGLNNRTTVKNAGRPFVSDPQVS